MKKLIVVAVAIVAIVLIAYFGVGRKMVEKYSYGTDKANIAEFFGVAESGEEIAVLVQNERIGYKAAFKNNTYYFPLQMIDTYLGEGFFWDPEFNGGTLMYTTAIGTYEVAVGESAYKYEGGDGSYPYPICYLDGSNLYIAADFVKLFDTFTYEPYEYRMQIYTKWDTHPQKEIAGDTQIRVAGGIKSEILREVKKGELVELVEEMENWSKVKTSDAFIGYIENKKMKDKGIVAEAAAISPALPEYNEIMLEGKVCLGFHSIGGVGGNDTIYEMMAEGKGMNVIAPTWFSMNDNEGGIRNFGTTEYVRIAHENGIWVWGVLDNFNYENETQNSISDLSVLGDTNNRRRLEINIINAALDLGIDGINLDFEGLASECGPYYAQFLKELSVLTHKHNLVLSTDSYVPFNFNEYYRLDVQGQVCDYVLIMGYDEHYHGSGNPGSVASFDYVANGLDKTLENVAPEKIINALPFYTIVWKNDNGTITDSYLTLVNQADYVQRLGISYSWDETTCQNYAQWTSGGVTYMLWLEDEESISAKLNAMNARKIGGVAVWRLGYGTSSVWNLIKIFTEN